MTKKNLEDEKIEKVEVINEDDDYEYEELTLEDRVINIEKKVKASFALNIICTLLIAFLVLLLLGGGNISEGETSGEGNTNTQQSGGYDTTPFNAIVPEQIASLSKGKTIVVWIGYQSCRFCQAFAPLLAQVTKEYGITANYIDISTVTQNQMNTVFALTGKGNWKDFAASFTGTPFTLIIKDNKVIGGMDGYRDATNIAKAFEEAGIKKR